MRIILRCRAHTHTCTSTADCTGTGRRCKKIPCGFHFFFIAIQCSSQKCEGKRNAMPCTTTIMHITLYVCNTNTLARPHCATLQHTRNCSAPVCAFNCSGGGACVHIISDHEGVKTHPTYCRACFFCVNFEHATWRIAPLLYFLQVREAACMRMCVRCEFVCR